MRASCVAILVLAASAITPALSAPDIRVVPYDPGRIPRPTDVPGAISKRSDADEDPVTIVYNPTRRRDGLVDDI
ncbi:hypothetical protein BJY52DRAFT_1308510 [Lactarius psammicola]|nr:hypothetical protein BJY52DRAFT_1308510 [Lactarius psammicola]